MPSLSKTELLLRLTLPLAAAAVLSVAVPGCLAVRQGAKVCGVVRDAKELLGALKGLDAKNLALEGATVTYADHAPSQPETSDLKAREGRDCFGNPWGPFVVGRPFRPSDDTVRRCAPLAAPSDWELAR